ncbi:transcription factor bHLH55-like [Malania oleifera]|uniref:transcription factor bHLH55-like n=1 Tax=Malania oleifera TaxID=397392 RepID=UPI0025ADD39F|nr:transcription factor bHLH55-like [Malania oleifera]
MLLGFIKAEYGITGKRSACDHLIEAVDYIKQLQRKIQLLSARRDKLKRFLSPVGPQPEDGSLSEYSQNQVMVYPCSDGVLEIVIISGFREEGLALSAVLKAMLEEGFHAVCCVSSIKANERVLHTIKAEVSDNTRVDPYGLQQKLASLLLLREVSYTFKHFLWPVLLSLGPISVCRLMSSTGEELILVRKKNLSLLMNLI